MYSYTLSLQDIEVQCVAVLNDTVGCLMSCAFSDHNTEIGVILGKASRLRKLFFH